MLFMVVEHFRDNDMIPVYRRLRESGRSLPEGLEYIDSWVEANFSRCFQLMRCDDLKLLQGWILEWRDCGVTFEIVTSSPARWRGRSSNPISNRGSPALTKRPREVDNVTLWVHPWRAAATCGRIWEEIEANVPFAL